MDIAQRLVFVLADEETGIGMLGAVERDRVDDDARSGLNVDAHRAPFAFRESGDIAGDAVDAFKGGREPVFEVGSCGSESDVAARMLEQLHSELAFETADCLGERGLRHVELFGAVRYVLAFGYFEEVFQLQQFHGQASAY